MGVKRVLDLVELEQSSLPRKHDRLDWWLILQDRFSRLMSRADWSFAVRRVSPLFKTRTGVRSYSLPVDFPSNFIWSGQHQDTHRGYVFTLNAGEADAPLVYLPPADFYRKSLSSEGNGRPVEYTIESGGREGKVVTLSPPPDNNSGSHYTASGSYQPKEWRLPDIDADYEFPVSDNLMLALVLEDQSAYWAAQAQQGIKELYRQEARSRKRQIAPYIAP